MGLSHVNCKLLYGFLPQASNKRTPEVALSKPNPKTRSSPASSPAVIPGNRAAALVKQVRNHPSLQAPNLLQDHQILLHSTIDGAETLLWARID